MNILVHLVRCVCLWRHRDASWPVCHTSCSFQHPSFLRSTPVHPSYSSQNGLAPAKGRKSNGLCSSQSHLLTCGHKRTTFITESWNSDNIRRYKTVISDRRSSCMEKQTKLGGTLQFCLSVCLSAPFPVFSSLFHFNVSNLEFNVTVTQNYYWGSIQNCVRFYLICDEQTPAGDLECFYLDTHSVSVPILCGR